MNGTSQFRRSRSTKLRFPELCKQETANLLVFLTQKITKCGVTQELHRQQSRRECQFPQFNVDQSIYHLKAK